MWIYLDTSEAWEIAGGFEPAVFLRALPQVCQPGDVLVFGGYDTSDAALDVLRSLGAAAPAAPPEITLNTACYRHNRDEYPRAGAWALGFRPEVVPSLVELSALPGGGGGAKDVFYDDFCAYRPGSPARPLMDFNHATSGGTLYLSNWVSPVAAQALAAALGRTPLRVRRLPGTDGFVPVES